MLGGRREVREEVKVNWGLKGEQEQVRQEEGVPMGWGRGRCLEGSFQRTAGHLRGLREIWYYQESQSVTVAWACYSSALSLSFFVCWKGADDRYLPGLRSSGNEVRLHWEFLAHSGSVESSHGLQPSLPLG